MGSQSRPGLHQVIVYLIDPGTAAFFTYLNSTIGARIAYEHLRERVVTMRALRGAKVVPLVKLSAKHRPEFEILSWHSLGSGGGAPAISGPTTPQISSSKTESPSSSAADATLAAMGAVSIPSTAEELADAVPW
jgi:hypothetical protein